MHTCACYNSMGGMPRVQHAHRMFMCAKSLDASENMDVFDMHYIHTYIHTYILYEKADASDTKHTHVYAQI